MIKFLKKILIFSASTISIVYLLQLLLFLRIQNSTTTGHDNLKQTLNINADLVFIGSSRCWAHFDPNFFQNQFHIKSINIGVDGHSELSMSYARLLDYLKENNDPKHVILSFDPFVSADSEHGLNTVHKDNFARYTFIPLNRKWETVNCFGFSIWEKYVPLFSIFKYKQLTNCILQNNLSKHVIYGYEKHEESMDDNLISVSPDDRLNYPIESQQKEITQSLARINVFCKQRGIKLICIQTPVYKTIYDEKTFSLPKIICDSLKVPFIDTNTQSIREESTNFYNSNHLNTNGVEKMNTYLGTNQQLLDLFHMDKSEED